MKIKSVIIENFKSISSIEVPIQSYGTRTAKSSTTIFVGINESGKSNILDALHTIQTGFDGMQFEDVCNKTVHDESKYVDLWVVLEIENQSFYRKKIAEKLPKLTGLIENIFIKTVDLNIYLDKENNAYRSYSLEFNEIKNLFNYVVTETNQTINAKQVIKKEIDLLSEKNKVTEKITQDNAGSFLKAGQELLTLDLLIETCLEAIESNLDANVPKIVYWKAKDNYLINDPIDLSKFKDNPSISIPLKNIFSIYGKKTNAEIKDTIQNALNSASKKAQLVDSLSEFLTKHVNKIWKEHKINLKINIDGNMCSVHVEDKTKKYEYYNMNQRSDGFRQFVSLILSLSAESETDVLKNNIVLLDEPEVHLHPSGIKFMRDELLKIGKRNDVLLATHSHYMVDTKTIDRHWIVQKSPDTEIKQLTETDSMRDEEVVAKAFGIDLMKELLPGNILLVEGIGDKKIINHLIRLLAPSSSYSIKHAGGTPKVYSTASIMAEEEIRALILLDDDQEGKQTKNDIIKRLKGSFNIESVFTLRDILGTLPRGCTLEDLYPTEFIIAQFEKAFNKKLIINSNTAILGQLSTQEDALKGKNNKANLDDFKANLVDSFISRYSAKATLKSSCPRCIDFVNNLLTNFDTHNY